ncbi:MAG TPA: peptide deformylase [Anaerolineales bacterium]|nr:peptide deformylase [Anaerolineales bacterium]
MSALPILTLENPILRTRARKVRAVSPSLRAFIGDMIETMRAAPGVGLAAPQVGVGQRVIVIEYADEAQGDGAPPKLYAVVNPEIVRRSKEMVPGTEGCLSIPGYLGEVERHQTITVRGLDRNGKPMRLKAQDWLARIFQHEIDHLDGVLFIDRASRVWKPDPEEMAAVQAIAPSRASHPGEGIPEGIAPSIPEGIAPSREAPSQSAAEAVASHPTTTPEEIP